MIKQTKSRGFTIVELLIVIVVIAILAAITIVAYNGIQTRANVSATQGNVTILQKKMEAYNSVNSSYPASGTAASVTTALNGTTESNLGGSIVLAARAGVNSTNGKNTFTMDICTAPAGATGYRIYYWDYNTGALPASGSAQITGGTNSTACTAWTALT